MIINGATELYGIMGDPVTHSLSPSMHNAAFAALGLNKVYVPFPVTGVKEAMDAFRVLGVRGVSVTIPHKQAVIPYLDSIAPIAEKIGAVNTLVIDNDHIQGLNTDWRGANRALQQLIGDLVGKSILILGAGGSAKALGFGFLEAGAQVAIASRTPASGKDLAEKLQCQWHPLARVTRLSADVLVNATSVGMTPHQQHTPVSRTALANFTAVMDIIYSPKQTRLLREAAAEGCQTINGLAMLLMQGAAQFELWTGCQAPIEIMQQQLDANLRVKPPADS